MQRRTAAPEETDSVALGAMMAAAGGFLDAFTYIGHGHVFANAMTGNVVLLGVELGAGNRAQAARHVVPICAFVGGVVFARVLHVPRIARAIASPHLTCMFIELAWLFVIGWLPATLPDAVFTLSIAFVASIQLSTFSRVRGAPYASTFTSGNLRKFAESAFAFALDRHDPDARILTIAFAALCLAFFVGAGIGSVCTASLHNRAAWVVDAWLALATWRLIAGRNREPAAANLPP